CSCVQPQGCTWRHCLHRSQKTSSLSLGELDANILSAQSTVNLPRKPSHLRDHFSETKVNRYREYWGKPAVRNLRENDGNVGIIRSPVRAIVPPDRQGVRDVRDFNLAPSGRRSPLTRPHCAPMFRSPPAPPRWSTRRSDASACRTSSTLIQVGRRRTVFFADPKEVRS